MSKTEQVWVRMAEPIITKKQVKKITRKATVGQKLRLMLRPSQYSVDGKAIIRYKRMDDTLFVMKRGTKL